MSDNRKLIENEIANYIDDGMLPDFDFHINTFGFKDPEKNKEDVTGYDIVITSFNNFLNTNWVSEKKSILNILDGILRRFLAPDIISGQACYCIHLENDQVGKY